MTSVPPVVLFLFLLLRHARTRAEGVEEKKEFAGLSLDELEMLDDFELRQLRDVVTGHGSVSRAAKDEDIDLFKEQQQSKDPDVISFFPSRQLNPMVIQMPDDPPPAETENKKHRLKARRKGPDKPKKDEQPPKATSGAGGSFGSSSPNGLREDQQDKNRSDNLTGEDYEKLAKLLQSFVNRRKQTTQPAEERPRPVVLTTTQPPTTSRPPASTPPSLLSWPLASSGLPVWAVTPKASRKEGSPRGLSAITEQEDREQTSFVVDDSMEKPEAAAVWHGARVKATTPPAAPSPLPAQIHRKFDIRKPPKGEDVEFPVVDSEVTQNPLEWEAKMRQLSRELSSILHKLKASALFSSFAEKEDGKQAESPKSSLKVVAEIFESTPATVDGHVGATEEIANDEAAVDADSNVPPTRGLSFGALKIKQKPLAKAYVSILREGIARQTDINEYVFIASITLIRDNDKVILVDTGLATDINGRTDLLTKLGKLNIAPPQVDYVITTHGHPDHAGNTNDFPDAVHFQGTFSHHRSKFNFSELFEKDQHQLTQNVELIRTPGHTPEDITVLVRNTDKYGTIAVCGDVFITAEDIDHPIMWKPMAWNERIQETSRKRLVCEADWIVPGHGKVFRVTEKMRSTFKC